MIDAILGTILLGVGVVLASLMLAAAWTSLYAGIVFRNRKTEWKLDERRKNKHMAVSFWVSLFAICVGVAFWE